MTEYRLRERSITPGDYNFIAGRLAFLAPIADVKSGVDRGDGTLGTYDPITGNYTDPGKANVLLGHDYLFGGVAQVAELDYDEDGRNTDPGIANVWNGVTYKIANVSKTGTKRASSIENCEAGNIRIGIYVDDVLGTYDVSTGEFLPSSSGFYTRVQATANKLLKGKGQSLILTRQISGTYDPVTGAATVTTTTQTGTGAIFDYGTKNIDGTLIKQGDKQLLLSVVNAAGTALTAPALNDTVTDKNGIVYTLVEPLKTIAPAGTTVMFECNLRV